VQALRTEHILLCPQCEGPVRVTVHWAFTRLGGKTAMLPRWFEGACISCSAFVASLEFDPPVLRIRELYRSKLVKRLHAEGVVRTAFCGAGDGLRRASESRVVGGGEMELSKNEERAIRTLAVLIKAGVRPFTIDVKDVGIGSKKYYCDFGGGRLILSDSPGQFQAEITCEDVERALSEPRRYGRVRYSHWMAKLIGSSLLKVPIAQAHLQGRPIAPLYYQHVLGISPDGRFVVGYRDRKGIIAPDLVPESPVNFVFRVTKLFVEFVGLDEDYPLLRHNICLEKILGQPFSATIEYESCSGDEVWEWTPKEFTHRKLDLVEAVYSYPYDRTKKGYFPEGQRIEFTGCSQITAVFRMIPYFEHVAFDERGEGLK